MGGHLDGQLLLSKIRTGHAGERHFRGRMRRTLRTLPRLPFPFDAGIEEILENLGSWPVPYRLSGLTR